MKIGFTGTRQGMTPGQKEEFERIFLGICPTEFHHGDCVGADADAHVIVLRHAVRHNPEIAEIDELDYTEIHIHPPTEERLRAFKEGDRLHPARPYQERNMDIVLSCNTMIACPGGYEEELRSGTWATIRKARGQGRPVLVIWPDGRSEKWG